MVYEGVYAILDKRILQKGCEIVDWLTQAGYLHTARNSVTEKLTHSNFQFFSWYVPPWGGGGSEFTFCSLLCMRIVLLLLFFHIHHKCLVSIRALHAMNTWFRVPLQKPE